MIWLLMRRESKKRDERETEIVGLLRREHACHFNLLLRITAFYPQILSRLLDKMIEDKILSKRKDGPHFYFLNSTDPKKVENQINAIKAVLRAEIKLGFRQIRANFLEDICSETAKIYGYPADARHRVLCFDLKGELKEIRLDFIIDKSMLNKPFGEFRIIEGGIYIVGECKNKYYPLYKQDIRQHLNRIRLLEINYKESSFIPCFVASRFHYESRKICNSEVYPLFETKAIYMPKEVVFKIGGSDLVPTETAEFYVPYAKALHLNLPLILITTPLRTSDENFAKFRGIFTQRILDHDSFLMPKRKKINRENK
jgi:hypothetical protein